MSRHAVINDKTKTVVNVIELNEGTDWSPPDGHILVSSDSAGPGDTYRDRKFIKTPAPTGRTEQEKAQAEFAGATSAGKVEILGRRLGLVEPEP